MEPNYSVCNMRHSLLKKIVHNFSVMVTILIHFCPPGMGSIDYPLYVSTLLCSKDSAH